MRRQSHPAVGISRVSLKISAAWQSKVRPSLCPVSMNFADLYSTGETRDKPDERPPHDSWSASTVQGGEQGHSKATSEAHEWIVYYASVEDVAIQHDTRSECEALRKRAHLVPVFLRSSCGLRLSVSTDATSIYPPIMDHWKETVQIGCLEQTLRQTRVKNENYKKLIARDEFPFPYSSKTRHTAHPI